MLDIEQFKLLMDMSILSYGLEFAAGFVGVSNWLYGERAVGLIVGCSPF